MSFFDRQGIPESLVRNQAEPESGCGIQSQSQSQLDQDTEKENGKESGESSMSDSSNDDGFDDDVHVLRNYSFISCVTDRTFEMHALVQLAMRRWLEAYKQHEQWKQQYVKRLSTAFPRGTYENLGSCQALFPHAKSAIAHRPKMGDSLIEWASLMHNVAWYAWSKGSAVEAIQLSETALEVRKKILGQEHEKTLTSMGMVCSSYNLGGRCKEAEEMQVRVVETMKRVLGKEHRETLINIDNLAIMTYWRQERWKEAEELQVQVMETMKRVLGKEDPDTLISVINLTLTYMNQGYWKKAEELQVQVVEITKSVLGKEHPIIPASMHGLATNWKYQGQNAKAIDLMRECVHLRTRTLGSDHPDTLTSSKTLNIWQMQEPEVSLSAIRDLTIVEEEPKPLGELSDHAMHSSQRRRSI